MEKLENLNSLGPRGRQATYCLLGVPCNGFLFSNFIVAKYTLTYLFTKLGQSMKQNTCYARKNPIYMYLGY